MTPEINEDMIAQLSELGVAEEKLYELRRQMQRADALRSQQGPQGATAGGIYVAANPLEHLAHGIGQYRANRDYKGAEGQIPGVLQGIQDARRGVMGAYARPGMGGTGMGDPRSQLLREEAWQTGQRGA